MEKSVSYARLYSRIGATSENDFIDHVESRSPKKGPSPRTLANIKTDLYVLYQQVSNLRNFLVTYSTSATETQQEMLNKKKDEAVNALRTAQGFVNIGCTISPRTLRLIDEIGQIYYDAALRRKAPEIPGSPNRTLEALNVSGQTSEETPREKIPEKEIRKSPKKKTTQELPKKTSAQELPKMPSTPKLHKKISSLFGSLK